jgi:hypothetical protein
VTVAALSAHLFAEAPNTWPSPPPMSTLHAILLFVGGPLLIICVITLLVLAPSLAKGPRYRPGQDWEAQPEWLGDNADAKAAQLTAGGEADSDLGGASARW